MSDTQPNITVPVDLTNPGQFFACCGLLELADRLWPGAEGWFERRTFCIRTVEQNRTLFQVLTEVQAMTFEVGDETEEGHSEEESNEDKEGPLTPMLLRWQDGRAAIFLDWWGDKSIKPWAGSMKERLILRAMLRAIDPKDSSPFDDLRAAFDPAKPPSPRADGTKRRAAKPKKREPFYFDPRRGNKSHPLDSGFSPDTHNMQAECCPALEALCFIGLQRARPASTGTASQSRYTVWMQHIPANVVSAVVCGVVPVRGSINYVFNNYFRTDQRKHKTFSQATVERS